MYLASSPLLSPVKSKGLCCFIANSCSKSSASWHSLCKPSPAFSTMTPPREVATWSGELTQEDFMINDECITVDKNDCIVGHANKYTAHRFTKDQPRGVLHRAFSVFLFDNDNRLLLQQRAASKITFPKVWTNTCCSHQLHGYSPTEMDCPEDIENASVPGAKRAAIRKLEHELGIKSLQVPLEKFKYLTRLYYCARDIKTWGSNAEWGEHEIDYILFIKAHVDLRPHPDEVMDTRYVSIAELKDMMNPKSGLLWSPWFKIIAENFLEKWWRDLDETLTSEIHVDARTIHHIM